MKTHSTLTAVASSSSLSLLSSEFSTAVPQRRPPSSTSSRHHKEPTLFPPRHSTTTTTTTSKTTKTTRTTKTMARPVQPDTSFLLFLAKVVVTAVVFWSHFSTALVFNGPTNPATSRSLTGVSLPSRASPITLYAGFGNTATSTSTKKSKKKKNGNSKKTSTAATSTTPFDVTSSLVRLEKKFDELQRTAAKQLQESEEEADDDFAYLNSSKSFDDGFLTSEYIIAARAASRSGMIPDWVPIAQMCLRRPESQYVDGAADPLVQMAVSAYCRELSHVAGNSAPVFSTLARNDIQYSVESVDSFYKHVYDEVIDGQAKKKETDSGMTKSEARSIFKLDSENADTIDKAAIKQAYRKLSFELHPDRFEGTEEECDNARIEFSRVQMAYETLTSGVRGDTISWYESLGGRARTGFVGPIQLLPLQTASEHLDLHKAEGGLFGLDPALTQSFVARNLRSA
mmetsp:Transcript_14190/g.34193  ORF Transcript_14190/g.34193 Transcript_14190/m.34193 type:complete len:456 (-) Transcript_14190:1394-2761(-)